MTDVKQDQKPELYTLLSFFTEVNEKTEKIISVLSDDLNKMLENPPNISETLPETKLSGAIGDLHKLITKANTNYERLYRLSLHLKKIV